MRSKNTSGYFSFYADNISLKTYFTWNRETSYHKSIILHCAFCVLITRFQLTFFSNCITITIIIIITIINIIIIITIITLITIITHITII